MNLGRDTDTSRNRFPSEAEIKDRRKAVAEIITSLVSNGDIVAEPGGNLTADLQAIIGEQTGEPATPNEISNALRSDDRPRCFRFSEAPNPDHPDRPFIIRIGLGSSDER